MSGRTNMIEPIHSLSFSIQSNPGVYAVLIGSGVSRAAGIPTGWEVTLDLITKLATLHKEAPDPNPETWFKVKFGADPDYSDLLDQLAKTATERQQLLREYWEPTEDEREEGEKEPTAAHHAIAALAARGSVRIIITTNFDRLMERALTAAGIEAMVLSSEDQIRGAPPLIHTQCCLFKVHGDYLDTRIRNTAGELAEYPPEVNRLLDRIFDEFGLVVCGWSGDWDPALRAALERAPSRRYTTYWTIRQPPIEVAERLIAHRNAELIQIEDADTFFETLEENIAAIEEFSKPHPLSVEVAVTKLKRYMSESRYRIQLSDLIDETLQEVVKSTSVGTFSPNDPKPTPGVVVKRLKAYDTACSKLTAMAAVGGAWANEEQYSLWHRALERLCPISNPVGYEVWCDLQRYPATLLLYALGLGAVERGQLELLRSLLDVKLHKTQDDESFAVLTLPPSVLLSRGGMEMHGPGGVEEKRTPLNLWIHDSLRRQTQRVFRDGPHFTRTFDKLEILLALGSKSVPRRMQWDYFPFGCFFWRGGARDRFLTEIKQSVEVQENLSPYVRSGICGTDTETCQKNIVQLERIIAETRWDLRFTIEHTNRS